MSISYVIISGLLLGLASSLHCAGMCGAIASNILAASGLHNGPAHQQFRTLVLMQAGRSTTYILAGLVVGGVGGAFDALLVTAGWQPVLRLIASLVVIYSGLAVIGIAPALHRLDRIVPKFLFQTALRPALAGAATTGHGQQTTQSANTAPKAFRAGIGKFSLGAALGLTPCAMVYNALLTAMMSGTVAKAGLFMACFALAALPAVIFAALGISFLQRSARGDQLGHVVRNLIACALLTVGILTLAEPAMGLIALCLST
ncbi:sulfite exporter TauE/SafE family protein [Thalassospira sp. HF15]|uniref:sulfite exporter TauE/SafE family protein n=1 Tax=Thalassospira sp. HF15 TaxID=2722755 RepID=UPI001431F786|nr:sulfite exporter TauE/SafE family protein [Thalassospira sp. HF15]NIY77752.1 sulfite exporter TauE/SafE family protein [Thalassospira sp. HF15]